MPVIESKLNLRDAATARRRPAMQALVDDLRAKRIRAALGGGEDPRAKHTARGKLLPA